jgi:phosphomevalonate kinase
LRARAPGKVVLSGAYAVLEGAPALVAAVGAYAMADDARAPTMVTAEVAAAIRLGFLGQAMWFDARALRREADAAAAGGDGGKLGLGSSAAILVASLATARLGHGLPEPELARTVFPQALAAHRAAQPGGSGIDVAASCFGGVLRCQLDAKNASLEIRDHRLPVDLTLEIWSCAGEASTQHMLGRVHGLRAAEPERYGALIERARMAAHEVLDAASPAAWVAGAARQLAALSALGAAAGARIVTPDVAELGAMAGERGACFGPAGAGGGDVALWAAAAPSDGAFRARAIELGLRLLPLTLGTPGVHRAPD